MTSSLKGVRNRIKFLERNLTRGRFATQQEVDELTARFHVARPTLANLWERWAHLKLLAMTHVTQRSGDATPAALRLAVRALEEATEEVHVSSINETFRVGPASYARINLIEAHSWWIDVLTAARALIRSSKLESRPYPGAPERCPECERPLAPGTAAALLREVDEELEDQRAMLLTQVTAPTPAPADPSPASWSHRITAGEVEVLKEAYHRVNVDVISNLPQPRSRDGERALPRSWGFLFAERADRERRPAVELMRNRSLGSIVAVFVLQAIRQQLAEDQAKQDAKKGNGGREKKTPGVR